MAKYRFEQIAINSKEKKKPTEEDRFTYIGLEHLDTGSLNVMRFGSDVAPIGEKLIMRKGDVLFGKRRAYQKKVAIAPFDGIFSAHGMVLRPKEDVVDKNFFPLFISSDYFLDAAIKISVGSLSPTINWRDLKDLEFEMPDLHTQKKLSEVLWAINNTIESYKKLIFATDELVKSQFIEWFGDPLTQMKMGKDVPVRRLGDMIILGPQNGLYKPQKFYKADGSGTPIVRVDSFYDGHVSDFSLLKRLQCTKEEQKLYCLENGDFVFNRVNGSVEHVGKCALIQGVQETTVFESNVMRIRVNENLVNICYLVAYLCSDIVRSQIKRTAKIANQASINQEDIKNLRVPLPTIAQQKQYAAFVHQSDKSKFELEQALSELTATYKCIISEQLG